MKNFIIIVWFAAVVIGFFLGLNFMYYDARPYYHGWIINLLPYRFSIMAVWFGLTLLFYGYIITKNNQRKN